VSKFWRKLAENVIGSALASGAAAAGSAAVERYFNAPKKDHACPLCESKITSEQYDKAMKECQVIEVKPAARQEKPKKGKKKS
jgi:hypothetical protein